MRVRVRKYIGTGVKCKDYKDIEIEFPDELEEEVKDFLRVATTFMQRIMTGRYPPIRTR